RGQAGGLVATLGTGGGCRGWVSGVGVGGGCFVWRRSLRSGAMKQRGPPTCGGLVTHRRPKHRYHDDGDWTLVADPAPKRRASASKNPPIRPTPITAPEQRDGDCHGASRNEVTYLRGISPMSETQETTSRRNFLKDTGRAGVSTLAGIALPHVHAAED